MNPKELFSVAIRVIGLWDAIRGFNDLLYFILVATGIKTVSVNAELPYNDLLYGLFFFFAGLYLLRGAPLVVNFAFPSKKAEIEDYAEKDVNEKVENSN